MCLHKKTSRNIKKPQKMITKDIKRPLHGQGQIPMSTMQTSLARVQTLSNHHHIVSHSHHTSYHSNSNQTEIQGFQGPHIVSQI